MRIKLATLTVDALDSSRQGITRTLDVLDRLSIEATIIFSGEFASKGPDIVRDTIDRGHEVAASTFHVGIRLSKIPRDDVVREIQRGHEILSRYYDVKTFRAPNMDIPVGYLRLLADIGYRYDTSIIKSRLNIVKRNPIVEAYGILRVPVTHEYPTVSKALLGQASSVNSASINTARDSVKLIHIRVKRPPSSDYEAKLLGKTLLDYIGRGYRFYRVDSIVGAWRAARQAASIL